MSQSGRPSPRCRALFVEVSRYLDGEVSPARRRTIERHITSCACCGTLAARLRQTIAACRAAGRNAVPRAVKQRAAKRIRALLRANERRASRMRRA
jgi:anti-sigma factor RsiW